MLRLAGCVLLDNKKRILLLHSNKHGRVQWELPGGKVDEGENEEKAAVRELNEELGVRVEIIRKLGSTKFQGFDRLCQYVWFLAEVKGHDHPHILEPQTFDALNYFSLDELDSMQLSPNMVKLLAALRAGTVNLG